MDDQNFTYSKEFIEMIKDLHAGKEDLQFYNQYIEAHLGGPNGRYKRFISRLVPEITYRCGDLKAKRILDFGCGTGSSTVALAGQGGKVAAYDIDLKSLAICQERIKEHGFTDRVIFYEGDFEKIKDKMGSFNLILMNGVIEHIPLSLHGARKRVILDLFSLLNPGGYLYINETPNRLFPFDFHTTKLWWLPWFPPGSKWVYKRVIKKNQHIEIAKSHSAGPLGLEERGVWGATYFEIRKYLSGLPCRIMNSEKEYDRHVDYKLGKAPSIKRKAFETIIYYSATKWSRMPITAFIPYLTNLVIQKLDFRRT
jgi:2-polyprenyl-3-methyl-5-hydroxy-6-metoxy-1,4-benzoquinol methylase